MTGALSLKCHCSAEDVKIRAHGWHPIAYPFYFFVCLFLVDFISFLFLFFFCIVM
jgi:hypothetical protein